MIGLNALLVKFKININTSYAIRGVSQRSFLGLILFFFCINELPQFVISDSLLSTDDTCIVFQHKNVTEIEKQLLRGFSGFCYWFVDNKSSIDFVQDKAKSILLGTKHKLRNAKA